MTKERAIKIAEIFAKSEGMKIGAVTNVLYDPIVRLDKLWDPAFAESQPQNRPKQWRIVFDLPDTTFDPGNLCVAVNDESGRAVIEEGM